jgi:hypothetical protein
MLNDIYSQSTARLSGIEDILNDIGYLSEGEKEGAGENYEDKYTKKSGKKSKDYDSDGDVEDETDEYAGVKDRAIKKEMKKEEVESRVATKIRQKVLAREEVQIYDELIDEMFDEGYTEENIVHVITAIEEGWSVIFESDGYYFELEDLSEAQEARNNPEKYEAGQQKKYAPVRGEKTPMPPRGNKKREDFEKWYAANVR